MFGLSDIRNLLTSSFSSSTRKVMDTNPHFIPLNLKALNASLGSIIQQPTVGVPDIDLHKFRNKIVSYIKGRYKNSIILTSNQIIINGKPDIPIDIIITKFTPAIVYLRTQSSDAIVGVLYGSYSAAANDLLNEFLNKETLAFLNESLKTTGKQFDLGYILQNEEAANEPVGSKIRKLFGILNSFSQNTVNVEGINVEHDKTSVLQNKIIAENLLESYSRFKKTGPIIQTNIDKDTSGFIKKIRADILIIQDSDENVKLEQQIKSSSSFSSLSNMLANTVISSKSFIDDIKEGLISKFTGKPSTSKKREKAKLATIDLRKGSRVNVSTSHGINTMFSIPETQVPVTSLQALLNENLAIQVKRNMGTGDSTDVLNYRTGRLAESFKVTAVSRDRQGALIAFYTYMKYPYITFGPGGAQQNPRSRDPKLLGDKSIREIAESKITARLRTVLI